MYLIPRDGLDTGVSSREIINNLSPVNALTRFNAKETISSTKLTGGEINALILLNNQILNQLY